MRIEERDGVAILRLEEGKGNAIGPPFLDVFAHMLDSLAGRPLVITGEGRIFSAGLQLPVLLALDRRDMTAFVTRFEEIMLRVFELPVPVVAALNGHAIAGGCVLALQADVRLAAAGTWKMGLNETSIGLGLPVVAFEAFRAQVPASSFMPLALEGRLVEPAEAKALGLLDAIVEPAELEGKACEKARALGAIAPAAFAHVKAAMRRPAREAIARHIEGERERWLDIWFSPATRARLEATVARLGR